MGHYETLGVDPESSVDEIRRSYLSLARREHPDLHNESDVSRLRAENRMRAINAAWSVLADANERAAYDRERLGVAEPGARPNWSRDAGRSETWAANRPDPDWRPYDASGVDHGFDERRDRPITSGSLPPWLAVAPVLSLIGGVVSLVGGAMVGVSLIIYLGVTALVASVVLFISAPLVALGRSRRDDRLD